MTIRQSFIATALCLIATARSDAATLYSIGNSLTLDCCGNGAIAEFDASLGNTLVQGSHIRLGAALDYMLAHPDDSVSGPPNWPQALPGQHWDFLAVEPYPSASSTLSTDIESISQLITSARAAGTANPSQVLLFAAWPSTADILAMGGFREYWNQSLPTATDQKTILARRYYVLLLAQLTARYAGSPRFRIVPAGDLMAAVDDAIRNGQLPALSSVNELYRDVNHLGDAGRYLAGLATILTMRPGRVAGLPVPYTYYQNYDGARITAPVIAEFEKIASERMPIGPPLAPQAVIVTPTSDGVRLSWTAQPGDTAYVLYRGGADTEISPAPADFSFDRPQFDVAGLLPGRGYRFAVRSISSTDISPPSETLAVTHPPEVPQDLRAVPAIGSVTLSWRLAEGATSYEIHAGSSADAASATLLASGIVSNSLVVRDAGINTLRYYFVVARTGGVRSVASTAVSAMALAAPPAPTAPPTPPTPEVPQGGGGILGLCEFLALLLILSERIKNMACHCIKLTGRRATA